MRHSNKETQCNIGGGIHVNKSDFFHYITISLLVVIIAVSLSQTRSVEPTEMCNEQCQKKLEDRLQTLLTPTLQLARKVLEDLEANSSKSLRTFDKSTNEMDLIKIKFEQTHNDFNNAASETKEKFSKTVLHLQEHTEGTLDLLKIKAGEAVSFLESIKDSLENHFSRIIANTAKSTDEFTKAQQGSVDKIETTTNTITNKALEVSNSVEQSMNEIKDTAQKSYDNFGKTQTELLDETKRDVSKFAKKLEVETNGISQKLTDLVVEVTKTTSYNVETVQARQDVLFNQIDVTLKGVTSSVEEMSKSTDEKLNQTMSMLQKTTQRTIDYIQNKTDASLQQFLKDQEDSLVKVEQNANNAVATLVKTSEDVVKSLEDSKKSTEKTISESITTLQMTTTEKMQYITGNVESSVARLQKAQEDSLGKIETLATEVVNKIEKSSLGLVGSLERSSSSTLKKINDSIATFQRSTEETVGYLQDKTDSSIDKFEKAQHDSIKKIEAGAKTTVYTFEYKGRAILKALDHTKITWRDSVHSIAENAIVDKEITRLRNVTLGESINQTRNLKSSVEEINKNGMEIVNKSKEKLFEFSVNFYITWCFLAVILVYSRSQQGTGYDKQGSLNPPLVRNNTGNNKQESKYVKASASPKDRQLNIPTGSPKYDITVVTFSTECLTKAPELFSKAMTGKTVQYRVLTGSLDLSGVPSSRGYVVLIGTDARNTIVEDMDGSAGSRKRETITALQKTQGDVLVIYLDNNYHDVEDPPEGALVNPHLQRTSSHPILRDLTTRHRLITLRREAWNSAQTEHLMGWTRRLR